MFLSYAVALRAAKYLSRRAVLVSIAALNALVLVAPPLLSTDLFSDIAYGYLGRHLRGHPILYGAQPRLTRSITWSACSGRIRPPPTDRSSPRSAIPWRG